MFTHRGEKSIVSTLIKIHGWALCIMRLNCILPESTSGVFVCFFLNHICMHNISWLCQKQNPTQPQKTHVVQTVELQLYILHFHVEFLCRYIFLTVLMYSEITSEITYVCCWCTFSLCTWCTFVFPYWYTWNPKFCLHLDRFFHK